MKKILITGGSGLVGSAIKRKFDSECGKSELVFVKSSDFDLTSLERTREMFAFHKPTHVIHLAACVGGLYKNMNQKVDMLEKNLLMNFNVVKCCHDFGVKKLLACLSTCIFPDKTSYPINEEMLHDGPPHTSNDAYAYAKRMLEIQCQAYRENYGDKFVCVIPTNIYGPCDNFNLEDAHVIPALIHKCYLAKQKDEDFVVRGTGAPLRQFIHSEDLAELMIWTLENYDGKSLILSVPENDEVSIGYVAKQIAKAFNYEHRMTFDPTYSDGQYKKTADNTKLADLLFEHHSITFDFIKIDEGIENTVRWFIDNYDSARK
jgi:GDP-L-fucose synthase